MREGELRLTELHPRFLKRESDTLFRDVDTLAEADGVMFLCPVCFVKNGGSVGTESILCWSPSVPQTTQPIPGRWNLLGTGFDDLTLQAGSSSILVNEGGYTDDKGVEHPKKEHAHFFIRNGEIV